VIKSNSVLLGGPNATEPILKGDTTVALLSELTTQLTALSVALQSLAPFPTVTGAAAQLIPWLQAFQLRLETTKSQISKTL
jgi:hypothetical protein